MREATLRRFKDTTTDVKGSGTVRLSIRTKPQVKSAIQRAAVLNGVSETAFVMNAAYEAARRTIEAHERTVLTSEDHAAFFEALDSAHAATSMLKHALSRHRHRVRSR